jgi:hypothetical protein
VVLQLGGWARNVYRVLVGKPEGKRPRGRPTLRWKDGTKMDLRVMGWGRGVERIHLAWNKDRWKALVNASINLRVLAPRNYLVSGKFRKGMKHSCHPIGTIKCLFINPVPSGLIILA